MKLNPFRKFLAASLTASALLSIASQSQAATLYYDGGTVDILTDGNSAASATSGNWNTTLLNWDAGPSAHVAWNNANNDTAFFNAGTAFAAPTPGTVTLTEAITAGGIIFNTSGYTISGSTLTLGGTNNTIALNNLATAATISSAIGTSAANLTFAAQNTIGTSTLTLGGTGGWTGSTTVNPGFTLVSASANDSLLNTSAITLNGGIIQLNHVVATGGVTDRVNNAANITSSGGTFSTLNTAGTPNYAETIGSVDLVRGLTTLVHGANQSGSGTQTLTLSGLTRTGSTNNSAVNFASSGGLNITKNIIVVTGALATPAGQIVGAWATTGNTGGANDYATYDASSRVVPAAIAATAESSWTTTTNAFTMNAGAGVTAGTAGLTATRTITALRNASSATSITADSSTDEITLASHTYANGDALIFGGTTVPVGLTAGTIYYVRDAALGLFKVAATSGGAAINLTTNGTAVTTTGALTLNAGANLETYGLLNGSANTLNVAPGTGGSLTTPSGGGYLNLTAGNGTTGAPINVAAPIINNGTVSIVKSGLGTLNLTGTNTFTGGIVVNSGSVVVTPSAANGFVIGAAGADIINGGNLTYSSANAWGVTGRDVTFNGTGTLTSSVAYTGATLTVNSGANAVLANTGNLVYVTTTGSGSIIHTPGNSSSLLNLGSASGFTGNLQNRGTAGGTATGIQFSSLGDGGALQFAGGNGDGNQAATFTYNGSSALSFGTRQIQILQHVGGNNDFRDNILANNSADAAHTWTITTDLLATGGRAGGFNATGTAQLILSGTNTGNNAFNGLISDGQYGQGANGNIGLTKSGTGASSKWIVSGNNTYSGPTSVSVGILNIQHANALGSTSVGTSVTNGARLELQGGITTATEALTLTPGTGTAMLLNVSGNNTWSGSITSNTLTNSQVSRIQSDADKLTISGAVSLTGSTHQLVLQGAGDTEISGQISGVGRVTSSVTGAGIRILSGNNTYTGDTLLNGSTIRLGNTNALGYGGIQTTTAAGNTTVSAGAVLDLNGVATINEPITVSGTGISSSGAMINNTGTTVIGSGIAGITIPTATTGTGYSAPPTVNISGTGTGATAAATLGVTAATFGTVTVVGTYTAPPTVAITGGGGTGATATVTNAGVLTITNPGTGYTSAPTITFTGGSPTSGVSMSATANATSFIVTGVNMTAAGSGYTGTPTYTFGSGDAVAGSLTLSRVVLAADSSMGGSGNITINAVVSESGGTRALTKVGAGTLTLAGSNTYTGATNVTAGTLALGADNALADATNITIGSATLDAVTFDDTVGTLDAAGSAVINLGAGASLAFTDSSAVDWTDVIGALNITGTFVSGSSIRFGTTNTGLLPAQLAVISVNGSGAGTYSLDVNGYLVSGGAPVGYAAWQSTNGTAQAMSLDHDNDGVSNGVEFFLGGTTNTTGFTALPGVTNTLGTLSVTWTKAASYTGTYGSGFVVETSATLTGTWTTEIADPNLGFTVTFPTANEVKFTFPNPLGTKNFARLKVTGP